MSGPYHQMVMDFQAATIRSTFESLPLKPIDSAFLWALCLRAQAQSGDRTTYQGSLKSIGESMIPQRKPTTVRNIKDRLLALGYIKIESIEGQSHVYRIDWHTVFSSPSKPDPRPLQNTEQTPPILPRDPSKNRSPPLQQSEGYPSNNRRGPKGWVIDAHARTRAKPNQWLL